MKFLAAFLLTFLVSFLVAREVGRRAHTTEPLSTLQATKPSPTAPAPRLPLRFPDAENITRELAHRSDPLLLPPRPFESDGSVSIRLAQLLGLTREELQALNGRLRAIAHKAAEARINAAKLAAATEDSATVFSPRQVALAQELEGDYVRTLSQAIGADHLDWLDQQEGLVIGAARQATGFLGATDTTWIVQKPKGPTSAIPTRYLLITVSAESAENVAQSSLFFDQLETVEPVTRTALQRHLPASFLKKTP